MDDLMNTSENLVEQDEKMEQPIEENIEQVMQNYQTLDREDLLKEFQNLLNANNFDVLKQRARVIKDIFDAKSKEIYAKAFEKFLEEGGVKEDYKSELDQLDIDFRKLYGEYRERRQKYLEKQEQDKIDNLEKKKAVLEELRVLLQQEGSLKEIYDTFNQLQTKWKEIGAVPRSEANSLWESYHFLIEKFYDKVKINRELLEIGMKKKIALCERVESLLLEPSINDSFRQLQECHQLWKEIGRVSADKSDEIWERFKKASDAVNKRCQEHYEKIREEQNNNLLAKKALCEKLEELLKTELSTVKDWTEATTKVNELFDLWKTIGPVPKEENENIWNRFKKPIDKFYEDKKEAFVKMKESQDENYQKKVELCLQAEVIAERNDWKRATEDLLKLQAEWKEVGYVAKKQSDKLWLRFRQACDKFFERKSQDYQNRKESENENIAKKEALIQAVKEFSFTEDKQHNLEVIKDFQRQWSEVGFVSTDERNRLYAEFRKAIDAHFDKLQSDSIESNLNNFKMKLDSSDGKRNVSREKKEFLDQIQKLQNDLNVWENNLGFLASSKQADLLKAEFDKKIEKAKAEIQLLKAKVKLLEESEKAKNE
ncbi:MAG: DUF349 domain-containing protein [Bacteroidales bacterium]|nr:DUF349 domain-containing protein [Bacteroidales bacterium]